MSLVPNIRQPAPIDDRDPIEDGVIIEMADEGGDQHEFDDKGNLLTIEHDDGSITLKLDGGPLEKAGAEGTNGWFDNLVDEIPAMELSRISEDLMRGIQDDLDSRKEWIEDRAQGSPEAAVTPLGKPTSQHPAMPIALPLPLPPSRAIRAP